MGNEIPRFLHPVRSIPYKKRCIINENNQKKRRRMIKKICNWIYKESPVFLEWLDYGFDDVVFLSAHAKRVGIRKKTA